MKKFIIFLFYIFVIVNANNYSDIIIKKDLAISAYSKDKLKCLIIMTKILHFIPGATFCTIIFEDGKEIIYKPRINIHFNQATISWFHHIFIHYGIGDYRFHEEKQKRKLKRKLISKICINTYEKKIIVQLTHNEALILYNTFKRK